MSEPSEAPAEGVEGIDGAPAAEAAEPNPAEQISQAAKQSGWAPKGEWKGDPKDWLDAPEFILKAAGEILPSMRKSLNESKAEVAKLSKALKDFGEHHSKTEQKAYERALNDLQARQDAAAEIGDVTAVRAITREIADMAKDAVKPAAESGPAPEPQELVAWKAENPWFAKSAAMRGATIEIVNELIAEGVTDLSKQLTEVDKRIRVEFPDKFSNPRRQDAGAVEAPSLGRRTGAKTWSDLTAEQKDMADFFVRTVKGFTREQYVKDTFGATR